MEGILGESRKYVGLVYALFNRNEGCLVFNLRKSGRVLRKVRICVEGSIGPLLLKT